MFNLIPLAIAALVAGTGANAVANRQVRRAQERAYDNYARRSDQRTNEAKSIFERSLGEQDVGKQTAKIDEAANAKVQRVDELTRTNSDYIDPLLPGQDRAPKVIGKQASRSLAEELAKARAQIGALAKLEGFSTRTFDRGLELSHVKPELGNLGLFAQGDRNILQAQMQSAAGKGQNLRLVGDILTGLGQVGLLGAGAGVGAGAGAGGVISSTSGGLDWLSAMSGLV